MIALTVNPKVEVDIGRDELELIVEGKSEFGVLGLWFAI